LWAAIFAVGSAVRRQVWAELVNGIPIFPNLFIFLVGPPGVGKTQAIVPMMETLRKSDTARLSPNDVTKQSLLDALIDAKEVVTLTGKNGVPMLMDYHYMAIAIRELSNFMSQYDGALAGILTDIFDNPQVNDEKKRTNKSAGVIVRPSLSLIAGTATKNLGATIGADLWGQGFMSRVLLVYSADQPEIDWFSDDEPRTDIDPALVEGLGQIGDLKGRMSWSMDAKRAMREWKLAKFEPVPRHSKLVEYNARRFLHVTKLCMVSALSDKRMEIEGKDVLRARTWLETAERAMPEIFKEMVVHPDGEVLKELHMAMWAYYSMRKQPISATWMSNFLYTKVASRDIIRLIEAGEAAGLYDRMAGTSGNDALFKPLMHTGDVGD
jgi:hypothetical protein